MTPVMLVAWTLLCVGGSAGLMYFIMQSRMELRLAKQREQLADAKATLIARREAMQETLRSAEAEIRSKALDEFLADIRVEERHYTREHRILFMTRKTLVRQERIYFRNIPLSSWVEQEMPIEEGVDTEKLAQTMSIFGDVAVFGDLPQISSVRKLLR